MIELFNDRVLVSAIQTRSGVCRFLIPLRELKPENGSYSQKDRTLVRKIFFVDAEPNLCCFMSIQTKRLSHISGKKCIG